MGDDGPSPVGPPVALNLRPGSALGLRRAFLPRGGGGVDGYRARHPLRQLPGVGGWSPSASSLPRCRLPRRGSAGRCWRSCRFSLGGPLWDIPPALRDATDLLH